MPNKLIHFNSDLDYLNLKNDIDGGSIVFVKDSHKITTHGAEYLFLGWSILESVIDSVILINSADKSNGVYAITNTGELINYTLADETNLGVALITNNLRIMIEKNGINNTETYAIAYNLDAATVGGVQLFIWGPYVDITSISNHSSTSSALSDFNGKLNTKAIMEIPDDTQTDYVKMCTYCRVFNENMTENKGYTDWYIPAAGLLNEIYNNIDLINSALEQMGGDIVATNIDHWSSTENYLDTAWMIPSKSTTGKRNHARIRFVRNIN